MGYKYNVFTDNLDRVNAGGIGGVGDVVGPASSTDNAIARFDGTTGKLLQNSTATLGDTGGIATTIANTGNATGLSITQNDTTNNPRALEITNAGTNRALFVDQNGNAGTATATSGAILLENTGNTGIGLNVYSNIDSTTSAPLVRITHDNTLADTEALLIQNDGVGASVRVNHNGNGQGMIFDVASTSVAGLLIRNSSAARTGTGTSSLVVIQNSDTTQTGQLAHFRQDAAGLGVVIDDNNSSVSLDVDKDVTDKNSTNSALRLVSTSVVDDGNTYTKSGSVVSFTSNVVETLGTITDSAVVLNVDQQHVDATGAVVKISNTGTANLALQLASTGGTAASGITWGTDANLYRVAADVLASDDSLRMLTYVRVGSVSAPTNTTAGDLTAIRGFVEGALAIKAGTASGTTAKVGGMVFDHFVDATVGGAETDIYTDTLAANTFGTNGDKVTASYSGNFVTVGTEQTQLKVYFAGTAIWDSTGVAPTTGTTSWRVFTELIRVSSTVVRYAVSLNTTGASGFVYAISGELTGLTLSGTNILKITGTSSGVGSGSGDIVGKTGYVAWQSAA